MTNFITPPETVQTSVYWYWISDHISKEGVVKDLHAMKEKGINRAFIGNIGLDDLPYGKVELFSEEWWEIMHLALKTATELDIEIGIFNSPGWSQSGGPWIKPEASMRYLTSSKEVVKGPKKISKKLEQPNDFFQDVKLLAYPLKSENLQQINSENATISSSPSFVNLTTIVDGKSDTGIHLNNTREAVFVFETKEEFTARSISISLAERPVSMGAVLQVMNETGEYNTISEFHINRTNPNPNVGFKPFAPVVISLPAVTAKNYKLILNNISSPALLTEVEISSNPKLERFSEKTLAKMHQTPLPYWDAYMWDQQSNLEDESLAINKEDVLDISEHLSSDGTLNREVPKGDWMIMRTGMTTTTVTNAPASPIGTGLEVDKMSKKWVTEHFDGFIGEILKRVPEQDRKSFKVVVQDSYETGGQNFTDDFIDDFKANYGYDPIPFLPVYEGFIVNSESDSERFLWDMRRLVANKVAYDYVGGLRDISHEHGLTTWLENYGHWGFPGEFLMYGGQSDEIGGEYWSEGELGDIENRAATSCGHIYGKTKISAESNTSGGPAYSRYPPMMKQRNDRFFAEGINNTLLHVYIMQPYEDKNPGVNAWFGNEFDRKNTWFSQLDLYTDYLKRVNYMLQQGLNVADAAYFIGEDTPKMTGITDPELPVGYQFDYINAEVIERDMTVKNGLLTLPHGTQYRILVLPKQETMRPELLKKISKLVSEGAVVLGPAPTRSPSLENQPEADRQITQMAARLGVDVSLIHSHDRPLNNFDADLVDLLVKSSQELGIKFYFNNRVKKIEQLQKNFRVTASSGNGKPLSLKAEMVFNCAGRVPSVDELNLEKGEVTYSKKGIEVNKKLQSISNEHVFACGDVSASDGKPLTPLAPVEAAVVISQLLDSTSKKEADYPAQPSVVFTIPNIASVGLSEDEAKKLNKEVMVKYEKVPGWFSAKHINSPVYAFKTITEKKSGKISGAHIIGEDICGIINLFALIIANDLTTKEIENTIFAYPTGGSEIKSMI